MLSARIINISTGGVALVYASGQSLRSGDEVNLDIMVSGTTSHEITNLRCKTVYDLLALSEGGSYSGVTTRQCGLVFTANSDRKEDQLAQILTGL
jgi:c-di-GMP-binding flagellar brake protein YcgR